MATYRFSDVNTISVDCAKYFWCGGYAITIFDVITTSPLAVTIILVDCVNIIFWCGHTRCFGRDVFVLIVRLETCSHMDNVIWFKSLSYRILSRWAACSKVGHTMFWFCPRANVGDSVYLKLFLSQCPPPPPGRGIQPF
jgi:hypothetical protein